MVCTQKLEQGRITSNAPAYADQEFPLKHCNVHAGIQYVVPHLFMHIIAG